MLIVEMCWGRPHEWHVQTVNARGELYVKKVVRAGDPDPERRTFSCHVDNWRLALDLGRRFGWQPKGPLTVPFPRSRAAERRTEYNPDELFQEVEADDARAWAEALHRCLRVCDDELPVPARASTVVIREGLTLDEYRQANRGQTPQFLRAFAEFMARGPFRFAYHED